MGLFSRVRRLNGSAGASAAAPATDTASVETAAAATVPPAATMRADQLRSAAPGLSSLRDGLQQLYSLRPSRDAFAEEAVKLLAKGAGVKAAALLGYEQRGGKMRLLAHVGLEAEAAQILSGDNMVSGWDIPLRSLRNRRINVIEAAHENPFIPKPLVAISPRRLTIATMPFFHASTPIGVVVFFSPTPRGFADGLLKALSQSLRVCALALSELPTTGAAAQRAVEDESAGTQPSLLRGLAALKAELARLTDALDEAERQRAAEAAERVTAQSFLAAAQERTAQLELELAELRAAGERLPTIEAEIHDLNRRLAAASEAADAAQTQVAQLRTAIGEAEQRSARDAAALSELSAARQQVEEQLQAALDTARQRGEEAAALHAQVAELTPRAAQASDLHTALAATDAAKSESEAVVARLRQELRTAEDQHARAASALAQTSEALAASESERAAAAAQLSTAQNRLIELDATHQELAALRERLQALDKDAATREHELQAVRAALGAGGQELAATAERASARIAELDSERATLAARVAAIESDSAAVQLAAKNLESRLAEQIDLCARLTAERGELQKRVDALAAGGQSLEQERQAAVKAAQQRGAESAAEINRLSAALDAARNQAAEELNRTRHDAAGTLDGLRVDLAEAVRARDELQRALAAAQQDAAAHQRALAEMSAERTRLEAAVERSNTERSELSARIAAGAGERGALERANSEATTRIAALEADLRAVRDEQLAGAQAALAAEREARRLSEEAFAAAEARYQEENTALRDQLAVFTQEQTRLAKELEQKELLLQSAEDDLTAAIDLSVESGDEDSVLDIDRDSAPDRAESPGLDLIAEVEAAAGGDCILLDSAEIGAAAVRQLAEFGHRVSALAPTPEIPGALKDRPVACAAMNLAAPHAWTLLRHLRNGSGVPRVPLIAYTLASDAPKGFWLGAVDFTILPVAQIDLVDTLNRMVPKVKRVIAMSNDIDVMSDVRTQLTRASISTAVVLDGRQALDLVPTIRPEAAVLHLSPSCADVFRAIAGLRGAEITRDIPIVFLLDAEAQPREEAFLAAGLRMLAGRGELVASGLVHSLASAFDAYRAV